MSHVHFTTLKHGDGPRTRQPEVVIKHQGSGSQEVRPRGSGPTNTPYKYKIITDEKDKKTETEEPEIDRKLSAPSKAYLPPAPVPTYLPPSARVASRFRFAWPGAITVGRGDATVVGISMLYCVLVWVHWVFVVVCV